MEGLFLLPQGYSSLYLPLIQPFPCYFSIHPELPPPQDNTHVQLYFDLYWKPQRPSIDTDSATVTDQEER